MTNVIERSPKTKTEVASARAFAAPGEPPAAGTRGMFRLGDLVATPLNVRQEHRRPEDVRSMAVTIAAHGGVLQNLLLVADLDDEGRWTGKLGAVAGETRRLALVLLRDGGIENVDGFTDDTLVPGLIVAHPEAKALSLTENAQRTAHPADEFVAFKALVDDCGSVAISAHPPKLHNQPGDGLRPDAPSMLVHNSLHRGEPDAGPRELEQALQRTRKPRSPRGGPGRRGVCRISSKRSSEESDNERDRRPPDGHARHQRKGGQPLRVGLLISDKPRPAGILLAGK
jgi:hypothetical protein